MPRTEITAVELGGPLDYDGVAVTPVAADPSNKNVCTLAGREILNARNTGASPVAVTITSKADSYGRTKDATFSIPAGEERVFGPYPQDGWAVGGQLQFEAAAADVEFVVFRLPSSWAGR